MKNIGNVFVRLFVISLLTFRYFSSFVSLFGAGAAPFFYGSGSGSEQTVSAALAPAPTKMCRLRLRLRLRLRIPGSYHYMQCYGIVRINANLLDQRPKPCLCTVQHIIKGDMHYYFILPRDASHSYVDILSSSQ